MSKSPQRRRRKTQKDEAHPMIGLTDEEVLTMTRLTVGQHLVLDTTGKQYQSDDVWHVLLWASARRSSVDDAAEQLADAPSANTVRNYLSDQLLEEIETLEDQLNTVVTHQLPARVVGYRHKVAIDLVFIPYHGQAEKETHEIRRSAAKSGTTHFHCYGSAYVIKRNKRVTLAFTDVRADDTLVAVLNRLLDRLGTLSIGYRRLLLDKGFYTVAGIQFLKREDLPFVIPMVHRGRSGGSRRLCGGKRSYLTQYPMSNDEASVTFDVVVVVKYTKGRYQRNGAVFFAYAVNHWTSALHSVYEEYRLRFGIESSYRLMNRCRARTSSRNPAYRLLLVGLAFLLVNIWVFIGWSRVSTPCQGGRRLPKGQFRLPRFLNWLTVPIEEIYGLVCQI